MEDTCKIEVPGTWRYIAVYDRHVTSGANGSNGRTTYFARNGATGQRFSRGLTNGEVVNPSQGVQKLSDSTEVLFDTSIRY